MSTTNNQIRGIQLFSKLSDAEIDALAAVLLPRRLGAGSVLFEQHLEGDTMIILIEGKLKVDIADPKGKRTEIREILPGEIVGEMAALDPAPRSTSVKAGTDVLILELSRDGLRQLRTTAPGVAAVITGEIIQGVTRRLRSIDERIEKRLHPPAAAATATPAAPAQRSVVSRIWSLFAGD